MEEVYAILCYTCLCGFGQVPPIVSSVEVCILYVVYYLFYFTVALRVGQVYHAW